ncbi:hypothetical protein ACFL3I_01130, partial [Pseudomonadota bacterium]
MALSYALLANAADPDDLIFRSSFERCDNISTAPVGALQWDGGGDGTSWNDPQNWKGDVLPAKGDDVWIADSGDITIVYNSAPDAISINTLDSCESLKITGGTLELAGTAWIRTNLELTGGNLVVTGGLKVLGQLQQSGGTLKGTGKVTVAGLFSWTGGTQSEGGETVANGGVMWSGSIDRYLNARTLTLNAASTFSGRELRLQNAATINNNSPLDIQTDDNFRFYTGTISTLNNNSTITKSAGSGITEIQASFNNNGTILVSSGELWMGHTNGVGTSTGVFQVDAGKILGISGTNTMTAASSFTGDGGFVFNAGGTTVIQGSYNLQGTLGVKGGTLSFANPVSIEDDVTVTSNGTLEYTQASVINADVYLSGGNLIAAGTLPISGILQQSGGTLKGTGKVTVAGL